MSAQLYFEVRDQIIQRIDKFKPATDTQNYLKAHFEFLTQEWTGAITAIFSKDNAAYAVILDENNECFVPWELLADKGDIYVSCFCGDLVTTVKSRVAIAESGYVENAENTDPPTPNIYTQIITYFNTFKEELLQDLSVIDGGSFDWGEEE